MSLIGSIINIRAQLASFDMVLANAIRERIPSFPSEERISLGGIDKGEGYETDYVIFINQHLDKRIDEVFDMNIDCVSFHIRYKYPEGCKSEDEKKFDSELKEYLERVLSEILCK